MDVPPKGIPVHLADLRNLPLRHPGLEQFNDERSLGIELVLIFASLAPDRPSQDNALCFLSRQSLLSPLADKVALYFR